MRWTPKDAVGRKPKCDVSPEGLFSFTGGVGAIEHVVQGLCERECTRQGHRKPERGGSLLGQLSNRNSQNLGKLNRD